MLPNKILAGEIGETSAAITYNGYTFPVYSKTEISGKCRYDGARRTVIGMDYNLTITFTVTASAGQLSFTDTEMQDLRNRLTKPGASLTISNMGVGSDLDINTASGKWDMAWGPTPQILSWQPRAIKKAFRCTWTCSFFIPECGTGGANGRQGVLAFDYRYNISVPMDRLATVTIDGYFEIAQTRSSVSDRSVKTSAGALRALIKAPLIPNFDRVQEDFRETMDRRRLDFVIVDKARNLGELPWGTVKADGTHSLMSNVAAVGIKLPENLADFQDVNGVIGPMMGSISVSYTMLPGFSKSIAQGHFADLLDAIVEEPLLYRKQVYDKTPLPFVLYNSLRISEGLYNNNRSISFETDYLIMCSKEDMFARGGFGRVAPNTDGQLWNSEFYNYGYAPGVDFYQVNFLPGNDIIVDMCGNGVLPKLRELGTNPVGQIGELSSVPTNGGPDPNSTWIEIYGKIAVEEEFSAVLHSYLVADAAVKLTGAGVQGPNQNNLLNGKLVGILDNAIAGVKDASIQERIKPRIKITFSGGGTRAFYTVPVPEIVSVNGKPTVPCDTGVAESWVEQQWGGVPIWMCVWCKSYYVESINKGDIKVPVLTRENLTGASIKI